MHIDATKSGFTRQKLIWILLVSLVVATFVFVWLRSQTPFSKAVSLIRAGKAAAALPILESLSHQQPDNYAIFPWLAQGYLSTERLAEGRTALDTALRLKLSEDDLVPVVISYANYYQSKGDYEEAEKLFESARSVCSSKRLSSGWSQLYYNWAQFDFGHSDLLVAIRHLELANNFGNDIQEPLKSQIHHLLSDFYRQAAAISETKEKNPENAINLLNKSLQIEDEPVTRMALANLYARINKLDEAIDNFYKVCRVDENNLEARHRLIDLLISKKDFLGAQEALMELTDKEKSVENYQLLSSVNLKMSNFAGSVHALEDAISLRPNDPNLLLELENALKSWSVSLTKEGKTDEASSVKGHAERVAEMLSQVLAKEAQKEPNQLPWDPSEPPIALSSSRIWLARGSLTPEGEIKIKNITGKPVTDLALKVVFWDKTLKLQNGTVGLPVALPTSPVFEADTLRSLYFSCPNIVIADHQLAVVIFWKGRLLKELPVVKM